MTDKDVEYTPLDASSIESVDGHDYHIHPSRSSSLRRFCEPNVWLLITILLGLLQMWPLIRSRSSNTSSQSVFGVDVDSFGFQEKRFGGAIRAHPNNSFYQVFDEGEPLYVGPPTPEIDQAWDELLDGRYVLLNENEIETLNKDRVMPTLEPLPHHRLVPEEGVYGGIDMLHTLHCINAIRKHIDKDHYLDHFDMSTDLQRMHVDHCIEQLRQAALCHGDITPVTLTPVQHEHKLWLLGQTERRHTCRNSDAIRSWFKEVGKSRGATISG